MRFTPTKKISELEALTSATLDTTFVVGISGSTTYKISINQLTSSLDGAFATDLVTTALSNSLDTKLATTIFNTNSASFHSRINDISSSVSTGTSGTSGTSGPQGNQGPIGPQGINGTAGSSGEQGPQGDIGPQGEVGAQGEIGPQGDIGPQGNDGSTGPQGDVGPQGPQGFDGTSGTSGTSGVSINSASFATTSSLNTLSSSVDSRLDTLEGTIISGSPNYTQILGDKRTNITTTGVSLISGSITTTGNPVQIMVTGDANPTSTGWCRLQIYRGESAIGNIIQVENEANQNVPYCLNIIDTPSAGTYTYSMRTVSGIAGTFEFGEASGPLLTAVELKTNTNLPSTNNTFTGTNTFNGEVNLNNSVKIGPGGGNEGGELNLAYSPNTTLTGSAVSVDVYANTLRIFEGGGNSRGVYIDLSKAPNGVAGELLYKASGFVNAGVDVTLGNLKARIPTTGNRSLQVSTISGTYSVYGSSVYSYNGIGGVTVPSGTPINVTTTPAYLASGYTFAVAGSTDTWNIMDTSAGIAWRITMIIGADFNSNFISIERLF
jgi:hypothetical protein